jgi:hypothetical protein
LNDLLHLETSKSGELQFLLDRFNELSQNILSENETTTILSAVTEMPNKTIELPDLSGFDFLSQHVLDTDPRTSDNLIALNNVLNLLDKVGNLSNTIINTNVTTATELDKITKKPAVIDETTTNNKSETNDDLFSFLNTLNDLSQALQNIKQGMTSEEFDDTTKAPSTTTTDETTAGVPDLSFLNMLGFGIPTTTTPISTTTTTTIASTTTTLIPATTTLEKSGNMFFIHKIKATQGKFIAVSDANRGNSL